MAFCQCHQCHQFVWFFCQRTCQRIVNYTLTIRVTIPLHFLEMSVACYTHFLDPNLSTGDRPNLYSYTLKSLFVANILSMLRQLHEFLSPLTSNAITKHCLLREVWLLRWASNLMSKKISS